MNTKSNQRENGYKLYYFRIKYSLLIVPTIVLNMKIGNKYIEPRIMPLRKKYRFISSFGMMLFMVSCLSLADFLGLDDINYVFFLPTMLISNNRTLFETYHTSEIVDQLDNFCLYLRPFNFYALIRGRTTRGNMLIPESIEKLFSIEYKTSNKAFMLC